MQLNSISQIKNVRQLHTPRFSKDHELGEIPEESSKVSMSSRNFLQSSAARENEIGTSKIEQRRKNFYGKKGEAQSSSALGINANSSKFLKQPYSSKMPQSSENVKCTPLKMLGEVSLSSSSQIESTILQQSSRGSLIMSKAKDVQQADAKGEASAGNIKASPLHFEEKKNNKSNSEEMFVDYNTNGQDGGALRQEIDHDNVGTMIDDSSVSDKQESILKSEEEHSLESDEDEYEESEESESEEDEDEQPNDHQQAENGVRSGVEAAVEDQNFFQNSNQAPKRNSGSKRRSSVSNGNRRRSKGERAIKAHLKSFRQSVAISKEAVSIVEEKIKSQKQAKSISSRFVISSSNAAYQIWKVILIILSFCSSFYYAYFAVFLDRSSEDSLQMFTEIDNYFETAFIIDLILHFFEEYHYPISQEVERDLRKLAVIYIKGRFLLDIVTIIPFRMIFTSVMSPKYSKILLLIKTLRLYNGFQLLNYKNFMVQIKNVYMSRIQRIISKDQVRASSQATDQTQIKQILLIAKIVKISQLVIVILCLSCLTGLIWYLTCDLIHFLNPESSSENFILEFGVRDQDPFTIFQTMTYFAFTTISTVGLGDLHPRSNVERGMGVFVMLFGVTITSYVMDNLNKIMSELRTFNAPYEESQQLSLFFGTMRRFNSNAPLKSETQAEIETYFQYRWQKDQNLAVSTVEDVSLLEQLPRLIQNQIYTEFLFKKFIETHRAMFIDEDSNSGIYKKLLRHFTSKFSERVIQQYFFQQEHEQWGSDRFQEFLISILKVLEPKRIDPKQILQKQNALIEEIIFLVKGEVNVGYNHEYFLYESGLSEIESVGAYKKFVTKMKLPRWQSSAMIAIEQENKPQSELSTVINHFKFPISLQPGHLAIGLFELSYTKRSQFLYRVKPGSLDGRGLECFFVRKKNWIELSQLTEKRQEVHEHFKGNAVINTYLKRVYLPICEYQQSSLRQEIQAKRSIAKHEYEKINASINKRISQMQTEAVSRKTAIFQMISKSKRGNFGDREEDSSSNDFDEYESSSSSKSSSSQRDSNSLVASYESDDSFTTEVKAMLADSHFESKQENKIKKISRKIKEMKEKVSAIPPGQQQSNNNSSGKLLQTMKEDFFRNLAHLRTDQEQKMKQKQARKTVKAKTIDITLKQDPVIEILKEFDDHLKTRDYRLMKTGISQPDPEEEEQELSMMDLLKLTELRVNKQFKLMIDIIDLFHRCQIDLSREKKKNTFLENALKQEVSGFGLRLLSSRSYRLLKSRGADRRMSTTDLDFGTGMPKQVETEEELIADSSEINSADKNLNGSVNNSSSLHQQVEETAQFKESENSSKKLHSYVTPEKSVFEDLPHTLDPEGHREADSALTRQQVGIPDFQMAASLSANVPKVEIDSHSDTTPTPAKAKQRSQHIMICSLEQQNPLIGIGDSQTLEKFNMDRRLSTGSNNNYNVRLKPIKQKLSKKALELFSNMALPQEKTPQGLSSNQQFGLPKPNPNEHQHLQSVEVHQNDMSGFIFKRDLTQIEQNIQGMDTLSVVRKNEPMTHEIQPMEQAREYYLPMSPTSNQNPADPSCSSDIFQQLASPLDIGEIRSLEKPRNSSNLPEKDVKEKLISEHRRSSKKQYHLQYIGRKRSVDTGTMNYEKQIRKMRRSSPQQIKEGSSKDRSSKGNIPLHEVPESIYEHDEEDFCDRVQRVESLSNSIAAHSVSHIEESLPEDENKRGNCLDVVSRHSNFGNKSRKSKFQEQQSIDEEIHVEEDLQMTQKWERESTDEVSEQKTIPEEIDMRKRRSSLASVIITQLVVDKPEKKQSVVPALPRPSKGGVSKSPSKKHRFTVSKQDSALIEKAINPPLPTHQQDALKHTDTEKGLTSNQGLQKLVSFEGSLPDQFDHEELEPDIQRQKDSEQDHLQDLVDQKEVSHRDDGQVNESERNLLEAEDPPIIRRKQK